jgi:hypothetical protein
MAAVCGLTLVKKFTYRGDATEEFSNTYHFSGAIPADNTAWAALRDALIAQEKTLYGSSVSVIRAYGYDSDADNAAAVYVSDFSSAPIAGTLNSTGGQGIAGDQAAWVRWKTSRTNANGKAIYLRKYFHGGYAITGQPDNILGTWSTNLLAFGTKLFDGSFLDGRTIRSRLHAETITVRGASSYLTTRTLKRRGKRPGS